MRSNGHVIITSWKETIFWFSIIWNSIPVFYRFRNTLIPVQKCTSGHHRSHFRFYGSDFRRLFSTDSFTVIFFFEFSLCCSHSIFFLFCSPNWIIYKTRIWPEVNRGSRPDVVEITNRAHSRHHTAGLCQLYQCDSQHFWKTFPSTVVHN